jgi:hypothetical protein
MELRVDEVRQLLQPGMSDCGLDEFAGAAPR